MPATVRGPIPTILKGSRWDWEVLDVGWSLQEIGVEASREMPSNMAVHGPYTGIIGRPLENLFD